MTGLVYDKVMMTSVFVLMFVGVNLTFFPLHFAGLHGFPRKYMDYPDTYTIWNVISSYGSIITLFSLFLFVCMLLESFFRLRLVMSDSFVRRRPEQVYSGYVFGHSYQSDIYFSSSFLK